MTSLAAELDRMLVVVAVDASAPPDPRARAERLASAAQLIWSNFGDDGGDWCASAARHTAFAHDHRRVRGSGNGYVACMTSVAVGSAQFL